MRLILSLVGLVAGVAAVCTTPPQSVVATYEELEALPLGDAGNTGILPFSPYLGLDYVRFQLAGSLGGNNYILYSLSQLSSSSLTTSLQVIQRVLRDALVALVGRSGNVPDLPLSQQPAITVVEQSSTIKLESLRLLCGVRNAGVSNIVPNAVQIDLPCTVVITPILPVGPSDSYNCTYTGRGGGYQACAVELPKAKGFSFKTIANLEDTVVQTLATSLGVVKVLELINLLAESSYVTLFDNITYTEYCG